MPNLARAALAVITCVVIVPSANAQLSEVQPGARIRVRATGVVAGATVATVLARSGDTITIGGPSMVPVQVPLSRLVSLEVSRGKSRAEGAKQGLKWGVPIGAAFGALIVAANQSCCANTTSSGELFVSSVLSGVIYGVGIGALIGRERWEHFDLAPRPSVGMRDRRATLTMRYAM